MNAVGIDASKGKSMVTILRPFGEIVSSPHEVRHTSDQIDELIREIRSLEGETRIVMEYTGRYHESMAHQLSNAGLFVSLVNPKLIKDFDNDSLRKVKTDKADSVKIARYTLDKWHKLKQYGVMDELRNQLKTMNRQFGYYTKLKTAMKNNLTPAPIPSSIVLLEATDLKNGWILSIPTGMWIASAACPFLPLLTITKNGAAVKATTSSPINQPRSMKQSVTSFRCFQKTL